MRAAVVSLRLWKRRGNPLLVDPQGARYLAGCSLFSKWEHDFCRRGCAAALALF